MEIHYSQHFPRRHALRNLPQGLAEEVFLHADSHFYDSLTSNYVAIRRLSFQDVERDMALVYRRVGERVVFITIHPLKEGQKERRVQSQRWTRYDIESAL